MKNENEKKHTIARKKLQNKIKIADKITRIKISNRKRRFAVSSRINIKSRYFPTVKLRSQDRNLLLRN